MRHTPGPWKVVRIDGELVGSIYRGKTRICAGILDDMRLQGEAEGNSALIAAAPDMYEALKNVCHNGCRESTADEFCLHCYVAKALRKARGEAE